MKRNKVAQTFFALLLSLVFAGMGRAQTSTASVTGVVTDSQGNAIAGATVTATNTKTGISNKAETSASGVYTIPLLPPSHYTVRAAQTGFAPTEQNGIQLEVNQVATINFLLKVGAVQQTVTVQASAQPLLTTQSGTGHVLEEVQIQNLPLQDRDVFTFVNLMPGVVQVAKVGSVGNRNYFDSVFSVNGGRASTNEVLLDGVPDTIGDFNGIAIVPPLGSVQEFKLQEGDYGAEYGRSGGGIVNLVTRSGGNQLHGELYEYFQNSALNANGWQANETHSRKVVNQRNHFGGDIGGPVVIPHLYNGKNRTFFFFDYEGRRQGDPFSLITSVPTAAERMGNFSGLVNAKGKPVTIYNPLSSTPVPGQPGQDSRTAFAGNSIPQTMFDPVAAKIINYWPQPNLPGDSTGSNNYGFSGKTSLREDIFDVRIDHQISQRNQIFGRISYEKRQSVQDNYLGTVASSARRIIDNFRNVVLGDTFTISPTLINDVRLGYTRAHANQKPFSTGFDPTTLGFPSFIKDRSNLLVFPDVAVSGNTDLTELGARGFNDQPRNTAAVFESLVKVHGSHTFKMGFDYELLNFNPFQIFSSVGTYGFDGSATTGPLALPSGQGTTLTSGAGFADFLLGDYSGATYEFQSPITIFHRYYAAYFQDDWKATRKLTLNLGIRWALETGTQEKYNRLTYFDFNAPNPLASNPQVAAAFPNLRGLLSFTGHGNPETEWNSPTHNFAPRVGLAYMINDKTVFRGGYGIFYLPLSLEPTGALGINRDIDSSQPDPYTPSLSFSNPFGGSLPAILGSSEGALTNIGLGIQAITRDLAPAYNQQWDVALQRSLPKNFVVQAAYVGSHGVHLPMEGLAVNQAPPSAMGLGSALNKKVANPFHGVITDPNSNLSDPTVTQLQLLRPFPEYSSVNWFRPDVGASNYQALQLTAEHRFSGGLSFQSSYTVSKSLDLGGEGNGAAFFDPTSVQNVYDMAAEKSLSDQDIPQRFVASAVYYLPYGRGRRFGSHASGVVDAILGGWQVSGIQVVQSGTPITLVANNVAGVGNSRERPNVVPGIDPHISTGQAEANVRNGLPWFNTAAFSIPARFTFGNASRTIGQIRTDRYKNTDFTLAKVFSLNERFKLRFEGEFFNLFNQTVFSGPSTNVNSPTFGKVFGQSNEPRLIQFALNLSF
ncbi:MAG: carboxypeptidase regulatory-like domain-containing protein [Terriglobia bacterium]